MFDGQIACTEPAREFFGHSLMYRPHERSRLFGMLLQREEAPMEAVDQPPSDARASVEEAPLESPDPAGRREMRRSRQLLWQPYRPCSSLRACAGSGRPPCCRLP